MRLTGTGNQVKLATAHSLLRVMAVYFRPARLPVDCWYMRGGLIEQELAMGLDLIGQVRIDTSLYKAPHPTGKQGRPCKYGERIALANGPKNVCCWICMARRSGYGSAVASPEPASCMAIWYAGYGRSLSGPMEG